MIEPKDVDIRVIDQRIGQGVAGLTSAIYLPSQSKRSLPTDGSVWLQE